MRITMKGLDSAKSKYLAAIGLMERQLKDKIKFDFNIEDVPGDGFCILNPITATLSPLCMCISEIKKNQILTEESHKALAI